MAHPVDFGPADWLLLTQLYGLVRRDYGVLVHGYHELEQAKTNAGEKERGDERGKSK
jgi:hypothetical protein